MQYKPCGNGLLVNRNSHLLPVLIFPILPVRHGVVFCLDSGRQYQKISTIKKYIDMVSLLKMNYFHWHLTEGLGWRIEIKQYPRLAQIGGSVGKGEEQQGFYTQKEIQEIIEYAANET